MDAVTKPVFTAQRDIVRSRLMGAFIIVLAAVSLTGCTGGGSVPFGSALFAPKTYALSPIIGAPPEISEQMTQALVQQGQANGVTIVPNGKDAPLTIRGYLVASRERRGATISYIWDVNDAGGKRVNRVAGEQQVPRPSSDPWSGVGATELRQIADKTIAGLSGRGGGATSSPPATASAPTSSTASAPSSPSGSGAGGAAAGGLTGFFNRNFGGGSSGAATSATSGASSPGASATSVASTGPATTLVATVTGAPGDGQTSLTRAMQKHLSADGIKLARSRGGNVYTVQGKVSVSSASGNRETVRIDWTVMDPRGKKLGTVSQQNTISKGSLNGPWGAIADAAAGAAADGIINLLPKQRG
ncbi:hypothetical protein [Methyloligella solikamskensis]|uniref:Lipoprotein n=1 Tax=Methyloligella solikamskensis TaxID=1177756 RepID=A0ABW3J8L6_9HYPH